MNRTRALALAALLCTPGLARAECEQSVQRADIALGAQAAIEAFRQLDRDGFAAGRDQLLAGLPCLAEPLQPGDAASVHGLMALSAFLDKDDGASVANLHAALRSDPGFDLPADLFPDGHPLRLHLQVARSLQPGVLRPLPVPSDGAVTVDGAEASHAPGDRPSLLQWTAAELEVRDTRYLTVGGPMPDWGPVPELPDAPPDRRPWALVGGAGASALAAGGLYMLAAGRHTRFLDPTTPYGELEGLRTQANAMTVASAGAGVLTVGFGTMAVLRW